MSSTTMQATSSTPSTSNIQLITDALVDYAKITGIDLSNNPFAAAIERVDSPGAILELLHERARAFTEYRKGNRRLISNLRPVVNVIQAFSGILGEVVNSVPFPPTKALFVGIDVLLSAARVESSYDALLNLFECLGTFVTRLEVYTTIPLTPTMMDLIVKIMIELLSVLALATKQIKQGRFKKFAKKLWGGKDKIQVALERLDRLTKDEGLSAVAQTLGVFHGITDDMRAAIGDIGQNSQNSVYQASNQINKMKRDQLQKDVQYWLSPPNPSTNLNFVSKARHKGTAAWFFESSALTEWKEKGSLLWIHGKLGAGKSTLLSTIIQDVEAMHEAGFVTMAYYYFDFRDVKKQDCYGLLSSLVSQLSAESYSFYNVLSKLYSDNNHGTRKPDVDTLKKCLVDMLSLPRQGQIYIIIDALDECPNSTGTPSAREDVLEFVEEIVNLNLRNVNLCVASRPEMDIRLVLEPLTTLKISLHDEIGQQEDIIKYIRAVVHSDRRMQRWMEEDRNLVIDTLSQNADGSFRWVVCQLDRLRRTLPHGILSVLVDLPPSLDQTYANALLGIDKEIRKHTRRLYQCLIASIRPLRVEELAEILAIRFDEVVSPMFNAAWRPENAEEAVMSACSSLVAIVDRGGHQVVRFSHFSVKEYLTSERLSAAEERLSYYYILPEPAHTILAQASLSVLLQLNDKIDRDTIDYFPLAPYAARHWVDHAQFGDVSSHVQELMERLFDPAMPHFAAWVWIYDIDSDQIEPMSKAHPTRPEAMPLYYASLCGFYGLVEYLLVAHPEHVNATGGHHVTSLHAALDNGHVKVAQLLLQRGADENALDGKDRTPLHLAAEYENNEIIQSLIDHGAHVNARDGQNRTPLHIAAEYGDTEVIQSLIDRGADTNAEDSDQSIPLSLASRRGRRGAAQLLLEHGADVGHQDSIGQTPMHEALDNGHVDIVRLLLDHGADAGARGRGLRTPLHLAAERGEFAVSQLLVQRGAEVDVRDEMDRTPLHIASVHGGLEILRSLISQGANLDARNKDQETPLFLASRNGNLEAARLLSEHGTDINSQDLLGRTPLLVATENGHYDIVHLLINHCADLNAPKKKLQNRTPLHLAADKGMFKVAELLLDNGAEVDAQDEMDWTPLHFAAQQGNLDLVKLLLEHHADVLALNREDHTFLDVAWAGGHEEIVDVNAQYEGGQTALHIAAQHGDTKLMSWLINRKLDPIHPNVEDEDQETPLFPASRNGKLDATRLLLDEKAEVNHRNWQKMTPLHGASENGHDAVARLLLERNAEVDAKHKNDWTPLHLASRAGQGNVAKVLLDKHAMVNAKSDSNWTALHMASQEMHLDVVRLLLVRGADVNIQNDAGETALHLAAYYAHLDVVQVLLDHGADLQIEDKMGEVPGTMKSRDGKTLLELASERGDNNLARILKLALASLVGGPKLGEIPAGDPVGEHEGEEQLGEQQTRERVMIPE